MRILKQNISISILVQNKVTSRRMITQMKLRFSNDLLKLHYTLSKREL